MPNSRTEVDPTIATGIESTRFALAEAEAPATFINNRVSLTISTCQCLLIETASRLVAIHPNQTRTSSGVT